MTFLPLVPDCPTPEPKVVENLDTVFLSTSQLFPDYVGRLDALKADLEKAISNLQLYKTRVDATYQNYLRYRDHTEEQRLSQVILNEHIRHFRDSFFSLLDRLDSRDGKSSNIRRQGLTMELISHIDNTWMDNGDYYVCERFLDYYNLMTESGNISKNSPGCERKLSAEQLVELVNGAYYAAKCLAKKYWEHRICALLPDEQDNPEMDMYGCNFLDRVLV